MIGGNGVECVSQGIKVVMQLGLFPRAVRGYQHLAHRIQSSQSGHSDKGDEK